MRNPFLVSSATSRTSATSSLVVSPEDASVKDAVATGTYSHMGCSKETKRVDEVRKSRIWDDDFRGKMRTLSYVRKNFRSMAINKDGVGRVRPS